MASTGSSAQVQSCPGCGGPVETAGLEPFAKVSCPAHLVLGKCDQMTAPKQARALAQALKARVHEVDAGHALMEEAPDAALAALRLALA